jgi:pentatricopeptide repeat protein
MQQNFEQPDVILYNTLLRACIQNKEAEKAITLYVLLCYVFFIIILLKCFLFLQV